MFICIIYKLQHLKNKSSLPNNMKRGRGKDNINVVNKQVKKIMTQVLRRGLGFVY